MRVSQREKVWDEGVQNGAPKHVASFESSNVQQLAPMSRGEVLDISKVKAQ